MVSCRIGKKKGVIYTNKVKDRPYVITQSGTNKACSCPSFTFGKGKPCKHMTPKEKMINRQRASKYGKEIAPMLTDKYESKLKDDPGLAEFLKIVS
jgi:predicted nucleic acid-binding Zn finger protein